VNPSKKSKANIPMIIESIAEMLPEIPLIGLLDTKKPRMPFKSFA
jgi:hypothetical protein